MVRRLSEYYARRIVNVNVNIVLAGVLALIPTVGVVHLTHYMGFGGEEEALSRWHKLAIAGITFTADVIFDVLIYYGLHWLANHWPKRRRARSAAGAAVGHAVAAAGEQLSFFRDATLVQFQRMMISPVLYTIWLGVQYTLMRGGVGRELATVAGFFLAITVARTIHTMWMLRDERAAARRLSSVARP